MLRFEGCVETAIAGPDSGFSCARLAIGGGIIVYDYVVILLPMSRVTNMKNQPPDFEQLTLHA